MNARIKVKRSEIMDKPKFKMTIEEMLEFNGACESAVSYHQRILIDDRDICLGKISAKALLKFWTKSKVLWQNGFCSDLDQDAMSLFEEYWEYKKNKQVWDHLGELEKGYECE